MIKVYQKTDKEINRVVKNFNQKVDRLKRLGKEVVPDKITKKELLNVSSRSELNRNLNSLKRFSRKGAEDILSLESGQKTTVWEKREVDLTIRAAKSKLTRKIKRYETTKPKVFGKVQAATFAQMGDQTYLNLVEQRKRLYDTKISSLENLTKLKKVGKKILAMGYSSVFRESYKTMLYDLAYQVSYDNEKITEIMKSVDKLNDSNFLKLFNDDKAIKSVIYYYKTKGLILEDISENIQTLFDEIYNNLDTIVEDYS